MEPKCSKQTLANDWREDITERTVIRLVEAGWEPTLDTLQELLPRGDLSVRKWIMEAGLKRILTAAETVDIADILHW